MDADAKKTALRMIPYGIYVMTAEQGDDVTAATVNWVTQTSFEPPLVAVGVKADSGAYALIQKTKAFNLNMLGKGGQGAAFAFFKPTVKEAGMLSGQPYHAGANGHPVLDDAIAHVECEVAEIVAHGDHHIILGQVTNANVAKQPEGRADDAILWMKDLGDTVFYGG